MAFFAQSPGPLLTMRSGADGRLNGQGWLPRPVLCTVQGWAADLAAALAVHGHAPQHQQQQQQQQHQALPPTVGAAGCPSPALPLAAEEQQWMRMARLLADGVDVDARDRWGKSALYYAAKHGHTDAIALLLRWGAAVDLPATSGSTPLMAAADAGKRDAAQLLLDHGADAGLANCAGQTAIAFAKDALVAALLRSAQAREPASVAKVHPYCVQPPVPRDDKGGATPSAGPAGAAVSPGCPIRTLTFNIRYGDATDSSLISWRRRRQRVLDVVRLLRPDVIAFQVRSLGSHPCTLPSSSLIGLDLGHAAGGAGSAAGRFGRWPARLSMGRDRARRRPPAWRVCPDLCAPVRRGQRPGQGAGKSRGMGWGKGRARAGQGPGKGRGKGRGKGQARAGRRPGKGWGEGAQAGALICAVCCTPSRRARLSIQSVETVWLSPVGSASPHECFGRRRPLTCACARSRPQTPTRPGSTGWGAHTPRIATIARSVSQPPRAFARLTPAQLCI